MYSIQIPFRLVPLAFPFLFLTCAATVPLLQMQSNTCLVQKAFKNDKLDWTFRYDEEGRIVETIKHNAEGGVESRYEPTYFPKGRFIETYTQYDAQNNITSKSVYQRDGQGRATRLDVSRPGPDGALAPALFVLYENADRPLYCIQKVTTHSPAGEVLEITEIRYTDDNGSYVSTKKKADGTLVRTETWTRDNRHSYELWSPFPYQAVHNLIGKKVVMADGSTTPESFSSVLEYNEQGYPVKEVATKANGTVDHFEYVYDCK